MGFNKGHMEFTTLNLTEGFHDVPGYPPGFSERIIAGSLDEKTKRATVRAYFALSQSLSLPCLSCMTIGKNF